MIRESVLCFLPGFDAPYLHLLQSLELHICLSVCAMEYDEGMKIGSLVISTPIDISFHSISMCAMVLRPTYWFCHFAIKLKCALSSCIIIILLVVEIICKMLRECSRQKPWCETDVMKHFNLSQLEDHDAFCFT